MIKTECSFLGNAIEYKIFQGYFIKRKPWTRENYSIQYSTK